jgi:hypothetical protein
VAKDRGAAAQAFAEPTGWRGRDARLSPEDREALAEARIAGLRAGLKLSPEQDALWPAVAEAMRGLSKERQAARRGWRERAQALREGAPGDLLGQLRATAARQASSAAALTRLADAATPLYATLDEGQKRRLAAMSHFAQPGERRGWRERGHRRSEGGSEFMGFGGASGRR